MGDNLTEVWVSRLPNCDICQSTSGKQVEAHYDAKMVLGPWAYMCEHHFQVEGIGLGTGRGQRLVLKES